MSYLLCVFHSVTGPFQADWVWRDGRVWPFEAAPLLWHHLLEWPTHTDTPQAHTLPASHVWGWWGLLWKRKRFYYSTVLFSVWSPYLFLTCLISNLSTMTSWASSATCRWPSPARHTPCRHMNPRLRRGPAATLSSTSTTWTITLLSWTCSSLRKRSSYCWTNRPLETPGKPLQCFNHVNLLVCVCVLECCSLLYLIVNSFLDQSLPCVLEIQNKVRL